MSSKWTVLREYAKWIESMPTNGNDFSDWRGQYFDEFVRHCDDISRNIYIMNESVIAFERFIQIGNSFEDCFKNPRLIEELHEICEHVGVNYDEYFDLAGQAYINRCLTVFHFYSE